MDSQKVLVYLTGLVAVGIVVVGLLATLFHSTVLAPIPILGLILVLLVFLTIYGYADKVEILEKLMFFVTFILIICSFILLYKPI